MERDVSLAERGKSSEDHLSHLSLKDIYGNYTLRPGTNIITDIPYSSDLLSSQSSEREELLRVLSARYDIPRIGGSKSEWVWGTENGRPVNTVKNPRLVITAGIGPPLIEWAPIFLERGAISALALNVSDKEKPLVLDIKCDSGLTTKLLSADNNLDVVGIDTTHLSLTDTVIENLLEEYGPTYPPGEREVLLQLLKDARTATQKGFLFHVMGADFGQRSPQEVVRTLQTFVRQAQGKPPVDVAILNMPSYEPFEIFSIRDGLHPKVIVYVKPIESPLSDDFYADESFSGEEQLDTGSAYNPGRNYRTLARWQTFAHADWLSDAYGFSIGENATEVVVQLRNDIQLRNAFSLPELRNYDWDMEVGDVIKKHRSKPALLKSKRMDYYNGLRDLQEVLRLGRHSAE